LEENIMMGRRPPATMEYIDGILRRMNGSRWNPLIHHHPDALIR